jgi:hypothetical protein
MCIEKTIMKSNANQHKRTLMRIKFISIISEVCLNFVQILLKFLKLCLTYEHIIH